MALWIQIVIFPFLGLFLGFLFAIIPFFCTGLQAQGMKELTWEEKLGFGVPTLLFVSVSS